MCGQAFDGLRGSHYQESLIILLRNLRQVESPEALGVFSILGGHVAHPRIDKF